MLICGLAVLGFIGSTVMEAPLERFMFDPVAVANGEYWRLFAFPTLTSPLWLLFFCLYSYFVFGTLEASWGEGPLTVFTLFSYTAALGASFLSGHPLIHLDSRPAKYKFGIWDIIPGNGISIVFHSSGKSQMAGATSGRNVSLSVRGRLSLDEDFPTDRSFTLSDLFYTNAGGTNKNKIESEK